LNRPLVNGIRVFLRRLGKGESKIAIVFGLDAETCHRAVLHLHQGAPGIPIRLLSQAQPASETMALCQSVYVNRHSLALVASAACDSWHCWVAIAVAPWTGVRGNWLLKSAPFLIPPFHALILNEAGDFFPGRPVCVRRHLIRRLLDTVRSGAQHAAACKLWVSLMAFRIVSLFENVAGCGSTESTFRYLRTGECLHLPATAPVIGRTLQFTQNGPFWDRAALELTLAESEASLLFWHEPGQAQQGYEDLLPFFEDPRTFVVSRQTYFRGWKPVPLPTAPFRALQPGETSQVMAPLSPAILVDCRKLLALGIPRASLSGTAWMILFWKAAAAGWQSFSVGPCAKALEQPDMPMEKASFRLHVFWKRSLRRIGPREPDLCRGNIAFAAPPRRAISRSNRLRVLLVSPFLPYPLSHGGAVRIFHLCRALSARVDFVLAAFRERDELVHYDRLREVFREVYIIDRDERPCGDERLPEQVREYENCGMRALISELAREWRPDILQIEYTQLARYCYAAPNVPGILVEHDLTYQLYRQLAETKGADERAWNEYKRWLEFERHWLEAYDGVWTVSAEDARAATIEGKRRPDRTFHVPNGVDVNRFSALDKSSERVEILYVSSFRHLPNILGFQKLRDEVLPRVWKRRPEVRCSVVTGLQHEEFWLRLSRDGHPAAFDPRVGIEGFVEDLRPLYARASVVVVPLEVSAGTNIKVLEAMACGKAIVTTPRGCDGLGLTDGREVFIAADWDEFSERILELIGNDTLKSHMGKAARRAAETRFDWGHIAAAAYGTYQELKEGQSDRVTLASRHSSPAADDSLALRPRLRPPHPAPPPKTGR
jgi:glycosyltransferase involved in cell wall biosynthesis